jgi:ribonuclease P protein component
LFKRAERLNASRDFARIYRKGQSARDRLFRLAWLPSAKTHIAVVTGRKVSTKAVIRNRLKRQVRAAAAELIPKLRSTDLIIQLQPGMTTELSYAAIKTDLADLLNRSKLLQQL